MAADTFFLLLHGVILDDCPCGRRDGGGLEEVKGYRQRSCWRDFAGLGWWQSSLMQWCEPGGFWGLGEPGEKGE